MVCPKGIYERFNHKYVNVFLFCDLSVNEFIEIQKGCSITYLPLDTNAPAGLIVLYQAAALEKLVVISDTPVTRAYISEDRGCLVELFDSDSVIGKMRFFLDNPGIRKEKSVRLKSFLREFCSEEKYVETIENLIEKTAYNK